MLYNKIIKFISILSDEMVPFGIHYELHRMNEGQWAAYVTAGLGFLNLLALMIFYVLIIRHNRKMHDSYSDQVAQTAQGAKDAADTAQRSMFFNFMSLYAEHDALEGRRVLYFASNQNARPEVSGYGTRYVRKACEVFDLLGMLIETKVLSISDVSVTLGEQISTCWKGMNIAVKKRECLLAEWRGENGQSYLAHFEELVMKYQFPIGNAEEDDSGS